MIGDHGDGMGLGIATCRMIARRHGSNIWCESKPNKETTFFFKLAAVSNHILLLGGQQLADDFL
jgi:signal transduction histidine kinase